MIHNIALLIIQAIFLACCMFVIFRCGEEEDRFNALIIAVIAWILQAVVVLEGVLW